MDSSDLILSIADNGDNVNSVNLNKKGQERCVIEWRVGVLIHFFDSYNLCKYFLSLEITVSG